MIEWDDAAAMVVQRGLGSFIDSRPLAHDQRAKLVLNPGSEYWGIDEHVQHLVRFSVPPGSKYLECAGQFVLACSVGPDDDEDSLWKRLDTAEARYKSNFCLKPGEILHMWHWNRGWFIHMRDSQLWFQFNLVAIKEVPNLYFKYRQRYL